MTTTHPIRGENAIDEVAFVILFEKELCEKTINSLKSLKGELADDLPQFEVLNVFQVLLEQNQSVRAPISNSKEGGIVCTKVSTKDPRRLEWSLRAEGNNIIVACSEYTNWIEVWHKAYRFLDAAIRKVDMADNPVIEVVFQCLDKFIHTGRIESYSVSDVFDENSDYLTNKVVKDNPTSWHTHQGWVSYAEAARMHFITNVNLNVRVTENRQIETLISHLVKFRNADAPNIQNVDHLFINAESGYLASAMDIAHRLNKDVMSNLLNSDMSKLIGLVDQ